MDQILGSGDAAPFHVQQVGRRVARWMTQIAIAFQDAVPKKGRHSAGRQLRFSQFQAFAEVTKKAANDKGDAVIPGMEASISW